jgi:tetratricopeptide (TPR) repeat protein
VSVLAAPLLALALAPPARPAESVQALLQRAHAQAARQDAAGAGASLQRARELAPNSEDVLLAGAQFFLGRRAPVPALRLLEPLTRMNPTVGQYRYLLGVALLQAGDAAGAVDALREAQRLERDRPRTLVALGLALNDRKQFEEALPHLERALELEPSGVEALGALAEAEAGLGRAAAAEEHARRALALRADDALAALVLGSVHMQQERYAEARASLEKAIAALPDSAKAYYVLSLACTRLGDDAAARAALATYRQKLGEREEAVDRVRQETGLGSGEAKP